MVVPSRVEEASKVRKIVGALSRLNGFPEEAVSGIEVAVGEAMANAVRHGSPAGPHDTVEVSFKHHDQRYLEVTVSDHGPGFDFQSLLESIDPLTMDEGHRGLLLIAALMDEVKYTHGTRGGTLSMRKYSPRGSGGSGSGGGRGYNHCAMQMGGSVYPGGYTASYRSA